ncbi:MAG: tetratricopeptide repeat protein [Candidatus Sericytochromatia bacterium]|nr:tetratricopeptide repeat protein [Candidatus Sericytochromatia bacterium]
MPRRRSLFRLTSLLLAGATWLAAPALPVLAASGATPAAEGRTPGSDLAWWTKLNQLLERRAYPAAEAELSVAFNLPGRGGGEADRLAYWLGHAQRRNGRNAEALQHLALVPADSRWFLPALLERAFIRRDLGEDETAIGLLEQAIAILPEDLKSPARAALADLYFTSGQYSKALELYRVLANTYGPAQERGLFAWGWSLLRLKQEEAATNVWKQALERFPTSRYSQAVRLALGNVMLTRGEHLAASTFYNEAARHGADDALMARAELLAGEAYADAKEYALALSHYRAVPPESPLREPASYGEAWATWQQGRGPEALNMFTAWLKRYPRSNYRGGVYFALGALARDAGNQAEASKHFEQVQKVAPRSIWAEEALYELTRQAFAARTHDDVLTLCKKMELQFPRSRWLGPVYWMRGETYLVQGNFSEAVKAYSQLAVLGNQAFLVGKGEEVDFKIGLAQFYAGNYQEAARVLEAVDQGPLLADAVFWQGEARYRLGQYDSARALYGKLVQQHPDFSRLTEAFYGLGWASYKLKDLPGARSAFSEAVRRFPEGRMRQDALYRLGLVLVEMREWEAARKTFETLLKSPLEPNLAAETRFQIAWSLNRQDRLEEAAEAFGALLNLPAAQDLVPRALLWRGRAYFRLKRFPEAITALKAATEHPESSPSLRVEAGQQLAAAHFNIGQFVESRKAYEALLNSGSLPPDHQQEIKQGVVQSLLKAGDYKQARLEISRSGAVSDSDVPTLLAIGQGFVDQANWDEVLETYRIAGKACPPTLRHWAGRALLEKRQWADAAAVLQPLRETTDQELKPLAQYDLARAQRGAGDLAAAKDNLVALSEAYPGKDIGALALREAAEVAREQKDFPAAQNLFRRVAENHGFPLERRRQAWMDLGDLHRQAKQWGPALLAYRGARGLSSPNSLPAALGGYWAGHVLVEMRQFKEAVRELSGLKFPDNAEPLPSLAALKLGEALEQLGRWREAVEVYNRLSNLPPSTERTDARARLDWIEKNIPKEARQ